MAKNDPIAFDVEIIHETQAALKVTDDGDEEHAFWVPKSLLMSGHDLEVGDVGTIELPEWFCVKEGLV